MSYTAFEDDGFVQICVDLEGYIEDYLTVYLFTIPGTALGKLSLTIYFNGLLRKHICICL